MGSCSAAEELCELDSSRAVAEGRVGAGGTNLPLPLLPFIWLAGILGGDSSLFRPCLRHIASEGLGAEVGGRGGTAVLSEGSRMVDLSDQLESTTDKSQMRLTWPGMALW